MQQVLGRNLEGTITKAESIKKEWKDDFTSVEHLVLAMLDDPRFGRKLLRDAGLDATKLTQAIKDIRGGNRVQDQACMRCLSFCVQAFVSPTRHAVRVFCIHYRTEMHSPSFSLWPHRHPFQSLTIGWRTV